MEASSLTEKTLSNSATVSSTRKPVTDEAIKTYMSTRVVMEHTQTAVLVDAFRFTAPYIAMKEREISSSTTTASTSSSVESPTGSDSAAGFGCLFFLSHYHSDHYTGLHPNWKYGRIFTGEVTGNLLVHHLGLPQDRVVRLKRNRTYRISLSKRSIVPEDEGADGRPFSSETGDANSPDDVLEVTLVNANHCPGAEMIVFVHSKAGTILHTGDFRYDGSTDAGPSSSLWCPASLLGDDEILKALRNRVDLLFLDNTFCDPSFVFPRQEHSFHKALGLIKDSLLNQYFRKYTQHTVVVTTGDDDYNNHSGSAVKKCSCPHDGDSATKKCIHVAILVGTYTIGKERIALAIREALQKKGSSVELGLVPQHPPVYVHHHKKKLLALTEFSDDCFVEVPAMATSADQSSDTSSTPPHILCSGSDFVEVEIDLNVLADIVDSTSRGETVAPRQRPQRHKTSTQRPAAPKNLFSSLDALVSDDVSCFATIFLTPLQALSYPCLINSAKDEVSVTPSGEHERPPRSLFLWDKCYLPMDNFDSVICIEPTGWAAPTAQHKAPQRIGRKCEKSSIPYSEHSSFPEMIEFVRFMKPKKIVPTVSVEQFKKQEPLFLEACSKLQANYGVMTPLTRFAHLFKRQSHAGELLESAGITVPGTKPAPPKSFLPEQPQRAESLSSDESALPIQTRHSTRTAAPVEASPPSKRTRDESAPEINVQKAVPKKVLSRVSTRHEHIVEDDEDVVFISSTKVCIELD